MLKHPNLPSKLWRPPSTRAPTEPSFEFKFCELRTLAKKDDCNPVLVDSPTQGRRRRVKTKFEDVSACIMEVIRTRPTSRTAAKFSFEDSSLALTPKRLPGLKLQTPPWRGFLPRREDEAAIKMLTKSVNDAETLRISSPGRRIRVSLPQAVPDLPLLRP